MKSLFGGVGSGRLPTKRAIMLTFQGSVELREIADEDEDEGLVVNSEEEGEIQLKRPRIVIVTHVFLVPCFPNATVETTKTIEDHKGVDEHSCSSGCESL